MCTCLIIHRHEAYPGGRHLGQPSQCHLIHASVEVSTGVVGRLDEPVADNVHHEFLRVDDVLTRVLHAPFASPASANGHRNLQDVSTSLLEHWSGPVLPCSKLNKIFFGYFDPENIFLDNENK